MSTWGSADVTVTVLAGGLGTRLRPSVGDRPKVLAKVMGRPFLAYILDQVADAGFQQVVLCTGYRGDMVAAEFGRSFRNLRLSYSSEPEPLGTGGALRFALPLFKSRDVMVLNGDSFVDADLADFVGAHSQKGAIGSLLLVWMEDTGRYGRVEISATGEVLSFSEKQPNAVPGWINAGIYILNRDLLAAIEAQVSVSLERDCFPAWLNLPLQTRSVQSRFLDIGTPESYQTAETFFRERTL